MAHLACRCSIEQSRWIATIADGRSNLADKMERGVATQIDPCAVESLEDFFAVAGTTFFSERSLLHDDLPRVADMLERFRGAGRADGH